MAPFIPHIDGIDKINYLINENIFYLEKLPQKMIILVGGAIGVELAQSLNRLGIKIHRY
ncbi:hypothetical protein [Tepidibacter aestuarii]|uniref:hypothetical protein n=1 Tax=Tepidibacter aestuarii TaxID=2925782 RepID=UPI0020BE92A7|nr:hypothetical protein [Tepidibacter aestuarii]CAH2212975.1 protein of unknown function [Tepidibacter aestuarii]